MVEEGAYALIRLRSSQKAAATRRGTPDNPRRRAAGRPEWHPGRMPTFIHTMPLSPNWRGRPDPFGGVAEGIMIETSHVTIQGLKMLGMPMVEHPKAGQLPRLPDRAYNTALDDLLITQCFFAGDEVTNPNHLAILVNGTRLVVDHRLFHGVSRQWCSGRQAAPGMRCATASRSIRTRPVYGRLGLPATSIFGATSSPTATMCGSARAPVRPVRRSPRRGPR